MTCLTRITGSVVLSMALALVPSGRVLKAQTPPPYLRDRGPGVRTSLLGTYVRHGELLVYPFFEWYKDDNLEYTPSELGYGSEEDFRGQYRASEGILFFAYGVTPDIAIEFEAAVISAELRTAPEDMATVPDLVQESGLGDVEGQIRWRFLRETATRPEFFTYFETVFPLQKTKTIIGTQDWEFNLGFGMVRGFSWGTLTLRAAAEYFEGTIDAGEYAVEYLRRLSPAWRVVAAIEGSQADEVSLITEVQWHFKPRAMLKLNTGLGLTTNATDFAPEVGVLFSF